MNELPDIQRPKPNLLWSLFGVIRVEFSRSFSTARIIGWLFLAFFPIFLVSMAKWRLSVERPHEIPAEELSGFFSFVLFILLPQVVTVLGLLLWATPAVNSEWEGQTWVYASVRPLGKGSMVLGKYLIAVLWTMTTGWFSATVCVPITGVEEPLRLWWTLIRLIALASFAYGALYMVVATFFQRRAMVFAILYTLIVEVVLATVPATVNQLTVGYRLRSLGIQWQGLDKLAEKADMMEILDLSGTTHHLEVLVLFVVVLLTASVLRAMFGEYSTVASE